MTQVALNRDCPLAKNPFALSLSKGNSWFDKLTTNGFLRIFSSNGQSRLITDVKGLDGAYSNELLLGRGYVVHGVKRCALFEQHCFVVVKVVNYHLCGN